MADNLNVTPGSGAAIASDEITWPPASGTTVHVPLGKLLLGADGAAEPISKGQQTAANGVPVTLANDQVAIISMADNLSNPTITIAVASFALLRDTVGSNWDRAPGNSVDGAWVTQRAATTGGATPYKLISAASTNATSVKAAAGTLYALTVSSVNAAMRYLKFYNKASAPTVGTDTPVLVIPIPGNTAGAGAILALPIGIDFSTGIALALTTGAADADTGAVAASEITVSLAYK